MSKEIEPLPRKTIELLQLEYDYARITNAIEHFSFHGHRIPFHMHESLARYVSKGVPVGDFLQAVIRGDLFHAVQYADDANQDKLHVFAAFFYNNTPGACWGSDEKYTRWIKSWLLFHKGELK
jgi:hypothetical protein